MRNRSAILPHMGKLSDRIHIAIVLPLNLPDSRARMSGALRFCATRNDIDVRVLDSSAQLFKKECERLTYGWAVDGLIVTMPKLAKWLVPDNKEPVLSMMDGPRSYLDAAVEVRLKTRMLTNETVELFRKRGFFNFGFCGTETPLDLQYSSETEESFCCSAGRQQTVSIFHEKPALSYNENLQRGMKWVLGLAKPCAVMCYSDELARNLLNACFLAKVKVPEQIAIIGLGNTAEICELTRPTLSSALPDFEESGYLAAKGLYQVLRSPTARKQAKKLTYGTRGIVERASTQDLRGCGRIVSSALELIRLTPLTDLSSDFITRKLRISRRLLEMHFKKVVGRGIHAEISRIRLERIRKELLTTSTPIARLTESCGFRTIAAAEIAFKKRFGVSMCEMRRQGSTATDKMLKRIK